MFWTLLLLGGLLVVTVVSVWIILRREDDKRFAMALRYRSNPLATLDQSPLVRSEPGIPPSRPERTILDCLPQHIEVKSEIESPKPPSSTGYSIPKASPVSSLPDWLDPIVFASASKGAPADLPVARRIDWLPDESPRPKLPIVQERNYHFPMPVRPAPIRGLAWKGPAEPVEVAGIRIPVPLVYTRDGRSREYGLDRSAIDVSLPVSDESYQPMQEREIEYWPGYEGLTPAQRRHYLDWLADERGYWPHEFGYVFLFIYGLERRALLDELDETLVFDQILHLRDLYLRIAASNKQNGRSFERYTNSFLWYLLVRFPVSFNADYLRAVFEQSVGEPCEDHLSCALSWLSSLLRPLPDWMAYELAEILPGSKRSVVLQRVRREHRDLFRERFKAMFPNGMPIENAKRERTFRYRPASSALQSVECRGPHPYGRPSQFAGLSDIWNSCIENLKKLSATVGRMGLERGLDERLDLTPETWEALPPALRSSTVHPLAEKFDELFNARKDSHNRAMVDADILLSACGIPRSGKPTIANSRRVADLLCHAGLALEPDSRITGKKWNPAERIVLFPESDAADIDLNRYRSAAYMLEIGLAIAAADGKIEESETTLLASQIQTTFELAPHEIRRLEARKAVLLETGITPASIPRPPKTLDAGQRTGLGRLILSLVAADGVVTDGELRAARLLFGRIGLDPADVDRTYSNWCQSRADEAPVVIQRASPGVPGEALPRPPDGIPRAAESFRIDRAAFERVMVETREVAAMLADAMNVEGEPEPATSPTAVVTLAEMDVPRQTTAGSLPSRYTGFYNSIISRTEWPVVEVEAIARREGLMLGGAIESVNDWAFETFGAVLLVEDGDRLLVETDTLESRS